MKITVGQTRLEACANQLNVCECILKKKVNELSEIRERLHRSCSAEVTNALEKRLLKQVEDIILQSRQMKMLEEGLAKSVRMYAYCEEEILQMNETTAWRYKEQPGMIHLPEFEKIKIVLK